jgi:ribosomal protein S18 acetylase RimI-like enzyme
VTGPFVVEPLGSGHNRRSFTCGVEPLDRYFREQVSQDIRRQLSNCFVAIDATGEVADYYTFSATSLPMTDLPPDEAKRLPRYPILPAGLIGRLAVATRCARQGLGAALILDAAERAARAEPAIFALIVDAKDDNASRFYIHLGFRPLISRPASLYWPIAEAARRLREQHDAARQPRDR